MEQHNNDVTLSALKEIRDIMDKSTRFVSLSGMSGIWAGVVALVGSFIAYGWLHTEANTYTDGVVNGQVLDYSNTKYILLAAGIFLVAFTGAFYFTYRKATATNASIWNSASKSLVFQAGAPMFAGGVFVIAEVYHHIYYFIVPTCLICYGLAITSGSRHVWSKIRYMGIINIVLGSISFFFPGYGLYFWAVGFGLLNIVYGVIMWNKYDK